MIDTKHKTLIRGLYHFSGPKSIYFFVKPAFSEEIYIGEHTPLPGIFRLNTNQNDLQSAGRLSKNTSLNLR